MYDKKVDFKQYTSVHDGWLFSMPQNLKLHNKICKFEQVRKENSGVMNSSLAVDFSRSSVCQS
jgi:hypothetical protein